MSESEKILNDINVNISIKLGVFNNMINDLVKVKRKAIKLQDYEIAALIRSIEMDLIKYMKEGLGKEEGAGDDDWGPLGPLDD